jgi:hypothetical protein
MRTARHVTRIGGMRNSLKIFVRKLDGERPLERHGLK